MLGVAGAESAASRKFTSTQYLGYDSRDCGAPECEGYVEGLNAFGVAAWIRRNASSGDQVIAANVTPAGHGFVMLLDGADGANDPDRLVFRYRYPSGSAALPSLPGAAEPVAAAPWGGAAGGAGAGINPGIQPDLGELEVNADVSAVEFNGPVPIWFHVAADVDLAAGTARLFLNGTLAATATGPALDPAAGGPVLAIGGGAPGAWFNGDLHDVCVVEGLWTAEPGRISGCLLGGGSPCISAADAVALTGTVTMRFNARLRQDPADSVQGVSPLMQPAGAGLARGMGPPITYADQPATVVVIGDTQFLDYFVHSENPDAATEMKRLGTFVRDYRTSLRVAAVFHAGDWVDHGEAPAQEVARARALANKLNEACIPWSCTIGNHDYAYAGQPVAPFLQYWSSDTSFTMPTSLFKEPPCDENPFVAQMTDWPPGSPDEDADEAYAHAFDFEIDGQPQLGITIPWLPSVPMLEWARDTANAPENASKPVWLSTHYFLDFAGNQSPEARFWWDYYLQFIPNLRFIFCGHFTAPGAYLAFHRCDGIYDLQPVHQILVNGQSAPGGGQGFLQILEVSLGTAGEFTGVNVESYIPLEDRFLAVTPAHEFTLSFNPCGQDCNNNGFADRFDIYSGASGDGDGDNIPDECERVPSGGSPYDLDHDGVVGIGDLLDLLGAWGPGPAKPADFNRDGSVGLPDLTSLLGAWGSSSG